MKTYVISLLSLSMLSFAGKALAADLAEPVPVAPAPVLPLETEASAFDWTGFYIGAQAAYGWGDRSITSTATAEGETPVDTTQSVEDFMGGLYLGYNQQVMQNWVAGAEADILFAPNQSFTVGGSDVDMTSNKLGTIRARLGYAFDNILVYGTGGLALGYTEAQVGTAEDSNLHTGFAVGGGLEAALTESLTARAEYLYVDTEKKTYTFGDDAVSADLDGHMVKVGIGYKF